ncbi:MAG: right-handed parallel beta-helix repeat-containing protein [Myxococcota bacterium]
MNDEQANVFFVHVARAMVGAFAALIASACSSPPPPPPPAPPPPAASPPDVAFVHPNGDDRDPGTLSAPFKTLARALSSKQPTIQLHPAEYKIGRTLISRAVRITSTATGARFLGSVSVATDDVAFERITVEGGLDAAQSRNLKLSKVSILAGNREDALSLVGSQAQIDSLDVGCGPQTCVQITTSTVTIRGLRFNADPSTLRGLRVSSSAVNANDVDGTGTRIALVQAELQSELKLTNARLRGGRGSAVAAVLGAQVELNGIRTSSIVQTALLAQTSTVTATKCKFGPAAQQTLSISGAVVRLVDTEVAAGRFAAANLKNFEDNQGQLYLTRGQIEHDDKDGVLGAGSLLSVRGTRFIGAEGPGKGNAISLRGRRAQALLTDVHMHQPAGVGLELAADAFGSITGTIVRPGASGVRIEEALSHTVKLKGVNVEGCRDGSAVTVLNSIDVRISDSQLKGCSEAGVLAGTRANVRVDDSVISQNARYGVAAFGGALLSVYTSTIANSPWAVFSACADRSRVVDAGGNRVDGKRGDCL